MPVSRLESTGPNVHGQPRGAGVGDGVKRHRQHDAERGADGGNDDLLDLTHGRIFPSLPLADSRDGDRRYPRASMATESSSARRTADTNIGTSSRI